MKNNTEDGEVFYDGRSQLVEQYCAAKGWNARDLTWEQIQEIRSQPEWNKPSSANESETVVRRDGPNLFIYEEGEFCCVCKSIDYACLERFGFGDPEDPLSFTVCKPCHDGDKFHEWLVGEFERAMIVHDENRKLPDGRWTTRQYDPI